MLVISLCVIARFLRCSTQDTRAIDLQEVNQNVTNLTTNGLFATKPIKPVKPWYLEKNIKEVLAATPADTLFIIENAGTRKIGKTDWIPSRDAP